MAHRTRAGVAAGKGWSFALAATHPPFGHAEEGEPVPVRSGDLPGDGAQRREAPAVILEALVKGVHDDGLPTMLLNDYTTWHWQPRVMVRHERCNGGVRHRGGAGRSEEHTSELQSLRHLVCRL